jgi:GntR family transcriptional regulator/MocR family aminotransferase
MPCVDEEADPDASERELRHRGEQERAGDAPERGKRGHGPQTRMRTGIKGSSTFCSMNETSKPVELLLPLVRGDRRRPLGRQIEDGLRARVRSGGLAPGAGLPSTRDLARQLGVSRRLVVDAYAQLSAEGYLRVRQGARPTVAGTAATATAPEPPDDGAPPPLYDLRPSVPDVSGFPRAAWLRSLRTAVSSIADTDLGYGDPHGVLQLRVELAQYLTRVRGVATTSQRLVITSGYSQSLNLVCSVLTQSGGTAVALEAPSDLEQAQIAARAGLDAVAVPVDENGLCVDRLADTAASAVVVSPAHQHPTGAVLTAERRAQLLDWLRASDAFAVEDDYDAEYRYDRNAVGALQGLDPDRVVYAGSLSKTLAPALRLGWVALPQRLVSPIVEAKILADRGSPRLEQLALADFLRRGELDRHLRRMRAVYRRRRDALRAALAAQLPSATVTGIAAGLHLTLRLPPCADEHAIREAAQEHRLAIGILGDYFEAPEPRPPTLLLGYARLPEVSAAKVARLLARVVGESS